MAKKEAAKEGTAKERIAKEGIAKERIAKERIAKEGIAKEKTAKEETAKRETAGERTTGEKPDKDILKLIKESFPRPVSTREISTKLKIAWHTADRHCLKLKLQGKIDAFTIGKSTAWYLLDVPAEKKAGKK